jgi:glyoxylase-like metal-dependent hydrolase (beta-lactamase superfamily II)
MEIARQDDLWLLAPDVACLPGPIVNVYLIGRPNAGDRGWTLIDAGFIGMTEQIARAAARRFGADARPAAILLTHGHVDHVSALEELAERWDVPVYAHSLELPYLTGRSSYPPPDPTVGGGLMTRLSVLFPRGPLDLGGRVHALPDDGGVPQLLDWRAIPTPGHAPGHVSFFREADRLLIAGDAFVTTKQESFVAALLKPVYIQGPPTYFTPDWPASRHSVAALAALHPASAGTGHGRPLAGAQLDEALDRLVRDFDRLAVPKHGRYVSQPAVADERGVVSVPPPPLDAQGTRFGGIVAALLAAALLIAIRRRMGASR